MTTRERATGALAAASAAALVVALAAPLSAVVVGVIVLGVLAVILEVRYLVGRFPALVRRDVVRPLAALLAGITLTRLLEPVVGEPARLAEVVLGSVVLALAARIGLRGRRRYAVWAAILVLCLGSLARPDLYAFALLHLHQVVVVVFLWDWATRLPTGRARRAFRGLAVGSLLVVPSLVLLGAADHRLSADPGFVRSVVGDGRSVVAAVALPGEPAGTLALQLLMLFAFLQTVQLLVWVAFMPRYAAAESAAFEARFPWLTGPRVWAVGFIAAAVLAVVLGIDFGRGQTLYAALSTWAVYLELPAALALLLGAGRVRHRTRWQPARGTLGAEAADDTGSGAPRPAEPPGTGEPGDDHPPLARDPIAARRNPA